MYEKMNYISDLSEKKSKTVKSLKFWFGGNM